MEYQFKTRNKRNDNERVLKVILKYSISIHSSLNET